jgi:hypothetical protein
MILSPSWCKGSMSFTLRSSFGCLFFTLLLIVDRGNFLAKNGSTMRDAVVAKTPVSSQMLAQKIQLRVRLVVRRSVPYP